MKQSEKEALKKIIKTEIEAIKVEIENIQKSLEPIKKDCSLDSIDHKMLKQEQNINIQRYEVAKIRLNKLQSSYLNIESDTYGLCKECEEAISIERLKLMPESIYCVRCINELGL